MEEKAKGDDHNLLKSTWRDDPRSPSGGYENKPAPPQANHHACVKPTPLLEWLVRLACPEGGTVLDPFMGSGSVGKACMRAGRNYIGIEMDEQWLPVARARIEHERAKTPLIADAG